MIIQRQDLYIWDFDGVISDSLIECLTVVAIATHRFENPDHHISRKVLLDICSVRKVSDLESWMRPLRPFIAKGQDYLWQYYHKDLFCRPFDSMMEYMSEYDGVYNEEMDNVYKQLFYDSRKMLIELMGEKYMTLFKTYQGAIHALRLSLSRHRNFICTARDRQALELILGRHQVSIPRERIYSHDFNALQENEGMGKYEQILEVLDNNGGRDQPFVIVEDQVNAPALLQQECAEMSVVFAAYGYGLASDWHDAELKQLSEVKRPADLIYEIY